jgi:hypothetical protein
MYLNDTPMALYAISHNPEGIQKPYALQYIWSKVLYRQPLWKTTVPPQPLHKEDHKRANPYWAEIDWLGIYSTPHDTTHHLRMGIITDTERRQLCRYHISPSKTMIILRRIQRTLVEHTQKLWRYRTEELREQEKNKPKKDLSYFQDRHKPKVSITARMQRRPQKTSQKRKAELSIPAINWRKRRRLVTTQRQALAHYTSGNLTAPKINTGIPASPKRAKRARKTVKKQYKCPPHKFMRPLDPSDPKYIHIVDAHTHITKRAPPGCTFQPFTITGKFFPREASRRIEALCPDQRTSINYSGFFNFCADKLASANYSMVFQLFRYFFDINKLLSLHNQTRNMSNTAMMHYTFIPRQNKTPEALYQ